jgi:hypothetical protein
MYDIKIWWRFEGIIPFIYWPGDITKHICIRQVDYMDVNGFHPYNSKTTKFKYWPRRDIICFGDNIKCDTIFELPLISKKNEIITTKKLFTLDPNSQRQFGAE